MEQGRTAVAASGTAAPAARDYRVVVRVLTFATFVVVLNETIMVNAIPLLMDVLAVSARAAQWLSTAFMLTMAVVIPVSGWFLQRVGTRNAFVAAMATFSLGTTLSGLAPTFEVLLAGRVVQAAGTAVMLPLLMTTLLSLVPEGERGRVMGNVTLAISVAPALGPAVSGLILQAASWRWLFGLVLPVALLVSLWGTRLLTGREYQQTRPGRLDLLSVALTAVGFGALVYGLSQLGGEAAEGPVPPVAALVVGLVGVALFALRQRALQRGTGPLLDLRVLGVRTYLVGMTLMSLSFMSLMGAMILLPIFLQQVRDLSALQTGMLLMPGGLAMGLLGPTVGRLYDRLGARVLVVPGALGVLAALTLIAVAATAAPWWAFLGLHVLVSVSLAFVFTPVFTSSLSALPSHLYPHGSALLGTVQQVAAAAGTALVVAVMAARAVAVEQSGTASAAPLADGARWGFAVTAVLAAVVLGLALLLPRRAPAAGPQDAAPPAAPEPEAALPVVE
ncbi:DHA2 family efflux MFS transporter permease subunit [Ornithinicoccus halotolerans]|uniref:DHA2 family efflux MFS transporter permease subunit n=1 Tax=Ornithinicoccus halotolerans TaxID=1748220 RepID=UPI0012963EBD|nr:DHA2 family efflux MFS transporter permease subunit [Ornithinicoccus halotolerans]